MDSPVKSQFRLARKTTTVGDIDVPAGTTVMVCPGAVNRDPRRFDEPARVQPGPQERPRAHRVRPRRALLPRRPARPRRGPGVASSASWTGWPTSRSTRTSTARPATRSYNYEPTFILRGLTEINIKFTPVAVAVCCAREEQHDQRSPRSHTDLPPLQTHVRNRPSGACATSPSWPGQRSFSFLMPCISGERNHRES